MCDAFSLARETIKSKRGFKALTYHQNPICLPMQSVFLVGFTLLQNCAILIRILQIFFLQCYLKLECYNKTAHPKKDEKRKEVKKWDKNTVRNTRQMCCSWRMRSGSEQPANSWGYPPKPCITGGGKSG